MRRASSEPFALPGSSGPANLSSPPAERHCWEASPLTGRVRWAAALQRALLRPRPVGNPPQLGGAGALLLRALGLLSGLPVLVNFSPCRGTGAAAEAAATRSTNPGRRRRRAAAAAGSAFAQRQPAASSAASNPKMPDAYLRPANAAGPKVIAGAAGASCRDGKVTRSPARSLRAAASPPPRPPGRARGWIAGRRAGGGGGVRSRPEGVE